MYACTWCLDTVSWKYILFLFIIAIRNVHYWLQSASCSVAWEIQWSLAWSWGTFHLGLHYIFAWWRLHNWCLTNWSWQMSWVTQQLFTFCQSPYPQKIVNSQPLDESKLQVMTHKCTGWYLISARYSCWYSSYMYCWKKGAALHPSHWALCCPH